MRGDIYQAADGSYVATGSFVLSCGCGGTSHNAKAILADAGVSDVPVIEDGSHKYARKFMAITNLKELIPPLDRVKHSVLINIDTGKYVNLLSARSNPSLYTNVRQVVMGDA